MKEKNRTRNRWLRIPLLNAALLILGLTSLLQLFRSPSSNDRYLSDEIHAFVQFNNSRFIPPPEVVAKRITESLEPPKDSNSITSTMGRITDDTNSSKITMKRNATMVTLNEVLRFDAHENNKTHSARMPIDPILQPIADSGGKFYIMNRRDRSGRVVADMLYAHAYAYANNLTFAGLCWIQGRHKHEVYSLLKELKWTKELPFACPKGIKLKKFAKKYSPKQNATDISPLILNYEVFKVHSNFKRSWIHGISKDLSDHRSVNTLKGKNLKGTRVSKPYEIAVQVRRGDIEPCKFAVRYLPNSHYLSLIDQYTPSDEELNGRTVHVTIYSESDSYEPFDDFIKRGYSVELDTPKLSDVWRALATADVAILSRSYFSMVPAIINPNTVVMTDYFQFDALEGWDVVHVSDKDVNKTLEMRDECRNNSNREKPINSKK